MTLHDLITLMILPIGTSGTNEIQYMKYTSEYILKLQIHQHDVVTFVIHACCASFYHSGTRENKEKSNPCSSCFLDKHCIFPFVDDIIIIAKHFVDPFFCSGDYNKFVPNNILGYGDMSRFGNISILDMVAIFQLHVG